MKTTNYNSTSHIKDLIADQYYKNLILLRNEIELACDSYFQKLKAPKIDLFLITQGVSSPSGKGSDSVPIPFVFGSKHAYLVDSAQFGMEPLVQKSFDIVYCYMPSFRGEDPDDRHLNQFFHCETEMRGNLDKAMQVGEGLVKWVVKSIVKKHQNKKFMFRSNNFDAIKNIPRQQFIRLTFDKAAQILKENNLEQLIEQHPYGRVLTTDGEKKLAEIVSANHIPIWITNYDRNTVAFYQKPDSNNSDRVLNADLIFPSINGGFGGEILGCGQRQSVKTEMAESMKRQEVHNNGNYDWYLNLRSYPGYVSTSGFGMGIERLIAWMLGKQSIVDCIPYPVLKNLPNTV